ncbi:MAG: putative toxin-antitoxin system toxin component, PIN family [Sulfuricella sp.]|nr:putative toxin-antitoxin system toxin component, PIN family [Sulfuricella sp.]
MRAVIDTNVLVSALLTPGGVASRLVEAIRDNKLQPVISHEVHLEYVQVLNREKFGFVKSEVADLLDDLMQLGLFVVPEPLDTTRLPDPDDGRFIAAARLANCVVIAGNPRHFPPESGIKTLSPAEALAHLTT